MDWSSVIDSTTFASLVGGMQAIAPIILTAVIIPLAVLRKGMDFIKGLVYGA